MSLRRRGPRSIAVTLETLRGDWQPQSPLGRAQTAWEEIGRVWEEVIGEHGAYLLERTQVTRLSGGVLTVRCAEAAVTETLTMESDRIVARLNERLGDPIRRLRCVTGS